MKIGIETLPFNTNYGGILQSYALMTYLKKIGHHPLLINFQTDDESYIRLPFVIAQRLISKYILRRKNMPNIIPGWAYKRRNR